MLTIFTLLAPYCAEKIAVRDVSYQIKVNEAKKVTSEGVGIL
jgi:hypothetical protein